MKKIYQELEMNVVLFALQDIVTLSGDELENFGRLGDFSNVISQG